MRSATAVAHPNIALCKYWGKRDRARNLPSNGSLSLTLGPWATTTTVHWGAEADSVLLDGAPANPDEARRVLGLLDLFAADRPPVRVESRNDLPTAAGLASSASGFAALVLAADAAAGSGLGGTALRVLARRGSGSATRSLDGGWVRWDRGTREDGADSHGRAIAPADHWDVRMVVAMVDSGRKRTGSTDGMLHTQATSPFHATWTALAEADLAAAEAAILARDLEALGAVAERNAMRMHATYLAADPPGWYWAPGTLHALETVRALRGRGVGAWATMDAGPNVKVLCDANDAPTVAAALGDVVPGVRVLAPAGPARLLP
ncbi:MAG: hypothetical protein RLZZ299_1912 [Pseudomonadota bacterium]